MKYDHAARDIQLTPRAVSQTFSLATNGKMFSILYESLYKRPMDAIMRELTSNIFDAHLMNGQTRPGEITLPSLLQTSLVFRDYGPGLSDADCRGLYTTLGASTKEEDENAIGAYGLGSKTPMAYTDAFVVTSRHLGKMRVYTVFKGADLIPVLTSDDVEYDADEPDGLEISIPAKAGDDTKWQVVASRVLRWFEPGLVTVHNLVVPIEPIKTVYETDTWMLTDASDFKSVVLSGPVTYELDWLALEDGPQTRVIFKMPLGSVAPQPSREGLVYDPNTLKVMQNAIAEFNVEFCDWIESQLVGLTPYDQAMAFRKLKAAWPGKPMPTGYVTDLETTGDTYAVDAKSQRRNYHRKTFKPNFRAPGHEFKPSGAIRVILNDLPNPKQAGVVKRLKENEDRFGSEVNQVLIVTDLAHVGNPSVFTKLSDYPLPYSYKDGPKDKTVRTRPMLFTLDSNWRNQTHLEEQLHAEPWDGDLYVPLNNRSILDPHWSKHLTFAERDGKYQVYGLTKKAVDYFDEVDLELASDYVKRRCKEMLSDPTLLLAKAREQNQPAGNMIRYISQATTLPADLAKIKTEFAKGYAHEDLALFNQALRDNLIELPKLPKVFNLHDALDKAAIRYPLFAHLTNCDPYPPTDAATFDVAMSSLKIRK